MAQIALVRHAETAWNREEVFRGRADIPLSDRGCKQASLLGQALAGRRIEAVYSSPLSRARDTAEAIAAALGVGVAVDERLVDMNYGEWEGHPRREVELRWPELYATWVNDPARFAAPGGETLSQVMERVRPALLEIAERHRDGGAAVVSHRVICKLVLCWALGAGEEAFWRARVDTASISLLEAGPKGWVVVGSNDVCHLAALGEAAQADF